MNVTALLDTPVRSSAPLDPPVGDDAADPAFANVMSQYQSNGNKSLAPHAQDDAANANSDGPTDAALPENAATSSASTEEAPLDLVGMIDTNGDGLPLDGQPLPLTDGTAAQPDGTLDATDASIAASMTATLPLPAAPPLVTPAVTVPVATSAPAADVAAIPPAPVEPTVAVADPATGDADAPVQLPPVDPRTLKKDGDAAALVQNTTAQPADDSTRSDSMSHALRSLGLGHRQAAPDGNAMPQSGAEHRRDPNGSSGDQLRNGGIAKIANAHLASALEAAAQKDPATLQKDGAADSIRTDAVLPRANGAGEAARDTLATRLGDLAQQHAPRFAAELADRVLVLRSQRFDSATVSLEPRELGRIDIQVRLQADTMHVAFTTQHAGVRDALEGQMPRLRAMLEDAGLSLGNVDVAHSGSRGAGDSGTARSYADSQSATAADADVADVSPRWQRRTEVSIIDLHA